MTEAKTQIPEASSPINREFLRRYGQQLIFKDNHEEYLYCGQRYGVSYDPKYPLDEGWRVYKIHRID